MRSFLLASTFGAAQSLAVTNKSKKPAVQALMESATKMLKNGATPQVVTFAQLTLDEVTGTVMPAILAESENDQTFIDQLFDRFEVIRTDLSTGNLAINRLNGEEITAGTDHRTCREAEHQKCYGDETFEVPAIETCGTLNTETSYGEGKRPCETDLYGRWEAWVTCENELRDYHDEIHGLFCPTAANGTTKEFRVSGASFMHPYITCKAECDEKLREYDHKAECCEVAHGQLDQQSHDCNQKQDGLEEKACEHASEIHDVLNNYYRDYAQALSTYECAVEEVTQLMDDRKKEWITLEVVRCLLDRIELQNGVPCDESTGTVTDAVGVCEQRHSANFCHPDQTPTQTPAQIDASAAAGVVWRAEDDTAYSEFLSDLDATKICLNFPEVPEHPAFCDDRNTVVGECLPQPIPTPCTSSGDVRWTYYDNLPGFPESTFTHDNPGCNAYPGCTTCADRNYPPHPRLNRDDFVVDTCPGYTVTGCHSDGEDVNALTYIRSVNGLADVRCCSTITDLTCKSQDFDAVGPLSPVSFTTPNEGTHTSCYFDVTYQNALKVCHAEGMRICSVAEMNSEACCGTGCWHDTHAVWVDTSGAGTAVQYHTQDQNEEQRQLRDGTLRTDSDGTHHDTYQEHRCQEGMAGWPACQDNWSHQTTAAPTPDWRLPEQTAAPQLD